MKLRHIQFFSLILLLIIAGCKKEEDETTPTPVPTPIPTNPTPASNIDEAKVLQLVNAIRQAGCTCGSDEMPPAPPLIWNDLLENAARAHSQEMSDSSYFSHTSLDGRNPGDRITAAGYVWLTCGENIAQGWPTEEIVVNAWKQSPGHCANMMNPTFKDMGVAKVGSYWTQKFGAQP
jgi:uncharacterized protein YkwD